MAMPILEPNIDAYLHALHTPVHSLFDDLEKRAGEQHFPIVGPLAGRFLSIMARAHKARRIFELGSGFGYSALWFALGAPPGLEIYCTDRSEENLAAAVQALQKIRPEARVFALPGDALQQFRRTAGDFDIIFMDIDKVDYPRGFDEGWPRVRPGGLFIADNALWRGQVAGAADDASTTAVRELNRKAFSVADGLASLVPLRDGLLLVMKVNP